MGLGIDLFLNSRLKTLEFFEKFFIRIIGLSFTVVCLVAVTGFSLFDAL